jgi:hypothetical protein
VHDPIVGAGALAASGVGASVFGLALLRANAPRQRRPAAAGTVRATIAVPATRRA